MGWIIVLVGKDIVTETQLPRPGCPAVGKTDDRPTYNLNESDGVCKRVHELVFDIVICFGRSPVRTPAYPCPAGWRPCGVTWDADPEQSWY